MNRSSGTTPSGRLGCGVPAVDCPWATGYASRRLDASPRRSGLPTAPGAAPKRSARSVDRRRANRHVGGQKHAQLVRGHHQSSGSSPPIRTARRAYTICVINPTQRAGGSQPLAPRKLFSIGLPGRADRPSRVGDSVGVRELGALGEGGVGRAPAEAVTNESKCLFESRFVAGEGGMTVAGCAPRCGS